MANPQNLRSGLDALYATSSDLRLSNPMGCGTGAFEQVGFLVLFALLDPADLVFATSYMTLGKPLGQDIIMGVPPQPYLVADKVEYTGQLSGVAVSLTVARAVFVNYALSVLSLLLPERSTAQIQYALSGHSGDFFDSIADRVREEVLDVLVNTLRRV
ncbi:hypothetical protein MMC28_006902, partial [Mycoblastus sanguinarius]|nr:hypothetical protein [Mycoblastus sanguinarius]